MGDSNKQVRVDNWGVFFLQRLQVFFNKTDYCDLTLQFEGNVQLKVHRLVMSACTEYFSVLEHTCEMIDGNTIVMPDDLQADVILPIVNFMYTGMLEFPMPIFDKLYRTAELMNIPILIKLLDAQRKPIKNSLRRQQQQSTWQNLKKVKPEPDTPIRKVPVWKRKHNKPPSRTSSPQLFTTETTTASSTISQKRNTASDPLALYDNTPKPTRFEWPEDDLNNTFNLIDSSFDDISYTSKPLLTQDDELRASTSFDAVKYSANVNQPKKNKEFSTNIDLNDVREYVKEQKIRTEMEFEEEDEDDPDNYLVESHNKRKLGKEGSPIHSKKVRFTINEKENKETTISVTPKTAGEMDHTKIISEVLKRYPHLVKKNKNIKLKIMAKSSIKDASKSSILKAPTTTTTKIKLVDAKTPIKAVTTKIVKPQPDEGPWVCKKCSFNSTEPVEFVLYYLYRKHMTDVHHEKFDAKMCKHCGHQSSKHNLLMYHQYTKHGVKPPSAYNFPKCPRCPFIALTEILLQRHLESAHSKYDSQCVECKVAFNSQSSLLAHIQITGHSNPNRCNYDCQYCTKRFTSVTDLFSHIRSVHRDEARRDGMVSIDETDMDEEEEEEEEVEEEEYLPEVPRKKKKVELLGNVKVGSENKHDEIINEIENSQGLVDIVVLDENQQYILHNEQQLTEEGLVNHPEYIIPELTNEYNDQQTNEEYNDRTTQANVITQSMLNIANNSEIASTDELVMVLTDHDYNDANNGILANENSNIVVLYSHPVDGQQSEFITSEGKLILNPQTGLLELRNDNVDNNSQEAQIESIELIQREINNGLIPSAEVDDDKSAVLCEKETLEIDQNNIKEEDKTVIIQKNDENVIETIPNEIENIPEEEIVSEIQEEETVNIETSIQRNEEEEEVEENLGFTNQFELSDNQKLSPEVNFVVSNESQEILQEEANKENVESVVEKNVDEETPIITVDLNEEEQNKEKEDGNIENQEIFQEDPEYLQPTNVEISDDVNTIDENVEKTEIESTPMDVDIVEEEIQPETDQEINNSSLQVEDSEIPKDDSDISVINKAENQEIIPTLPEVMDVEEKDKEDNENIENEPEKEIITEPNVNKNELEKDSETENETTEIIPSPPCTELQETVSNTNTTSDTESKEPTKKQPDELIDKNPINEPTDILEETTPILEESTIPLPNMEEVESVEEITEVVQVQEDTQTYDEVNVLLRESMEIETVDENSQQSQDSQNSTSQSSKEIVVTGSSNGGAGGVPNEATKISILNDWEDTEDSQQSDYPGKTGMENAVNKIIHDWDDDDDEAQVMNT